MEKKTVITEEQLNNLPKDLLISMYLQLSETMQTLTSQNDQLIRQISSLEERIAILTQQKFGRKTEKLSSFDGDQLTFDLNTLAIINEAEYILEKDGNEEEPEMENVIITRKKRKGKRDHDLSHVEVQVDEHLLPDEKLDELFPRGYDRLADEVYSDLEYIPAKFVKHEHHVAVYAGKHGEGIVRADRPERLLSNSILTTGLAAAIFNGKYVNALPINRMAEEFERLDVVISRQVMSGWMIKIAERYLGPVYRRMMDKLQESSIIHCDETPFKLVAADKTSSSKEYMWMCHSNEKYGTPPIYLYHYGGGRGAGVIDRFIQGYKGIIVADGYEVYHKLERERDDLKIAGCWAHARRQFADIAKSVNDSPNGALSTEAVKRIAAIYHVDNMYKDSSEKERLSNRQKSVKPLVDAYFEWVKSIDTRFMDKNGNLCKAINYSINQEKYLRRFLDDPLIPLDNNEAERSIRKFCVGKHNWNIIASENGAYSSGILYSIAETSKANGLKPFEYFKYLLDQILEHLDDPPSEYLDELMPWSDQIPENCRRITN